MILTQFTNVYTLIVDNHSKGRKNALISTYSTEATNYTFVIGDIGSKSSKFFNISKSKRWMITMKPFEITFHVLQQTKHRAVH